MITLRGCGIKTIITIPIDFLFCRYKPESQHYYDHYWRKDGNYLWIGNHPLAVFAEDYVKYGYDVLNNLDDHVFIRYEYDRYKNYPTVKNDTHKFNASKRIMVMVDSVRKHGYCSGKYNKKKHLIRSYKVSGLSYYPENSYVLKSRKHRACACCALNIEEVKIKLVSMKPLERGFK